MEDSQPPLPPAVSAQQGGQGGPPPLQQFAQGAAGQGQMPSSDQLMGQYVDQLGATMTKLAQVTVQTKPELVPILKQAIQALAMFAGKVKTSPQGQGGAQAGVPDGGSQGTAGTNSPDAGGGAALGMPQ